MINKRHTDFYIPVLRVLEDMKPHDINQLIEEVANTCQLSDEDKKIMTKGGTNLKYRSHIQWAVTDLRQAGYIEHPERGVNKISFEGMLMLEDNPEKPTREYLYKKSEKFRDFVNRKGTRSRHNADANLFEGNPNVISSGDGESEEKTASDQKTTSKIEIQKELNTLYEFRKKTKELGFSTREIDDKIKKLKSMVLEEDIVPVINEMLSKLPNAQDLRYIVMIDMASANRPAAYIYKDRKMIDNLTSKTGPMFANADEVVSLRSKEIKSNITKDDCQDRTARRPSALLKVVFGDGTIYDSKYASDNFSKSIEKMGAAKVAALGYKTSGMPLVGLVRPEKYNCQKLENGYYVATNIPNDRKKYYLESIAKDLDIAVNVSLID